MLVDRAIDTKCNAPEPPEVENDDASDDAEADSLGAEGEAFGGKDKVINDVGEHEDRKVERWELSSAVSYASSRNRQERT